MVNSIMNNILFKKMIQPIIFFVVYFFAIVLFFIILVSFQVNGKDVYDFIMLLHKVNKILLIVGGILLVLGIILINILNKNIICKVFGYIFLVFSALMIGFRNHSNNMINVEELDIEKYKGKYTNIDDNFYLNYEDSDSLINVVKIKSNESAELTIGNIEYYNQNENIYLIYNSDFDMNKYEKYLMENGYSCTKENTNDVDYNSCTINNLIINVASSTDKYFVMYETR